MLLLRFFDLKINLYKFNKKPLTDIYTTITSVNKTATNSNPVERNI